MSWIFHEWNDESEAYNILGVYFQSLIVNHLNQQHNILMEVSLSLL